MTTKETPNILLIDDLRTIIGAVTCRTYAEGIAALQATYWDTLYLDHDLGEEKTGYDVMCFLEANPDRLPGKIKLVTSNPVGRERMEVVIRKLYA